MIYWENVVNITFPIVHYTNKEMLIDTLRAIVNNSFKKCIYEKKKTINDNCNDSIINDT